MFGKIKTRITMSGSIGQEFQCLEGYDQTSNVFEGEVRIPMSGRRGPEFQFLKDRTRIAMFERKGEEF